MDETAAAPPTDPACPAGLPPETGHAGIDAALAAVADLDRADLAEHLPRLTEAHAAVRAALDS
ncbi:MAG: hypothetical protein LBI84_04025 [Propionibacteriaceae bacterium]|nr:hypothetical protein [Propionibacteriaceae bacterium]